MKLAAMVFLATLLGSIPVMAVVTHQRDKQESHPNFATAVPTIHSLILYDVDGARIAFCNRNESTNKLTGCQMEPDATLDEVMNAWLMAYQDR